MGMDKSSVLLKWTPPTMDGGAPVSGYIIEYRRRGSFQWKRANSIPCEEMNFSVTGLKEGEEYEFRVSAENKAGVGPASEMTKPVKVEAQLGKLHKNKCIKFICQVHLIVCLYSANDFNLDNMF